MNQTENLFTHLSHRPWPLPRRPWVLQMRWEKLLFAHWPVEPALLRPLIPEGLELETFNGTAWVGVVPFEMSGVRPRGIPACRAFSDFPELNLRTYVRGGEKSGVWFFSLDAGNKLAVRVARALFHLPYYDAKFELSASASNELHYQCLRTHRGAQPATINMRYSPVSEVFHASAGSFEHWLTERYCLFSANSKGEVFLGEIHHRPWPLQRAEASITECHITSGFGFTLDGAPAHLLYADFLDVRACALTPLRT